MTFTRITLVVFYILVGTVVCLAQRPPIKYGKIDEKDTVALASYQDADAVILCDYGEYKLDGKTGVVYFEFKHHLRIKILTEAGLRYATQQIQYYDMRSAYNHPYNQSYTLRAQTLNVNAKGELVISKVKSRFKIETKPDREFNASVTVLFPDVKPGSVIEYEITIPTTETVNPPLWMVQYDIPVLWNELRILTPQEFNYAVKPYNIDYSELSEIKSISTSIQYPGKSVVYNANQFRFIRKNVPSLPYPGNDMDYNNSRMFLKFMLDFASKNFLFPQMAELFKATDPEYKYLNKSEKQLVPEHAGYILYKKPDLQKIAKDLNKSERFGTPMILNMGLNDTLRKITGRYNTDEDKVMAVYDFVRSLAEWNYQYRIFVSAGMPLFFVRLADKFSKKPAEMNTGLQRVIQKQQGTNSEINAILINSLRAVGFKAKPVLASTLKNGYLDTAFFNLHQFNHLIAAVEVNGEEILLDAVQKGDGSIMSSDIMNEFGLMIESKNARWIQVAYTYPVLPIDKGSPGFKRSN